MSQDDSVTRHKRKRKKTFLRNARKYAKKGCYGRGTQLDADTYQYFVRIMEAYREGFDTEEDKAIFINNVFDQTTNQEIDCCCNQVGSRVIEALLPFASNAVLQRYIEVFEKELRPLCSDRFASHVLETLVALATKQEECQTFVVKVGRFLLNNLEDYLWDTYGSHVIRTCLQSLAQLPKDTKNSAKNPTEVQVPDEFAEIIEDYAERVMHWPQFTDLCDTETSSGFLQVLLKALKKIDSKLLKKTLDKLVRTKFAPDAELHLEKENLPNVFLATPAVILLEVTLDVVEPKMYTEIYEKCFSGRLLKLATTRTTNFCVQKLINNCTEKPIFEQIFDELSTNFKEIIRCGHTGVIWSLGQGCKGFATKQGSFSHSLMKALDCFDDDRQSNFILCLCKFADFETSQKDKKSNLQKDKLNLHGTLTLQLLLEFNKPIKVVNGLLSMDQSQLVGLFSNTMGSHIVDSFVTSTFVGEKSRDKLIRKMKGGYQELASSKYGSRSFEALWNAANIKSKQLIMEELSRKEGSWSNSEHGRIIAAKVKLALFKRNKDEWKSGLNVASKAEKMFADIIK